MARYKILYWKTFPVQVKCWHDGETVTDMLPKRFERAANVAAMVEGSSDSEAYLAGWHWGATAERPGSPTTVLEEVVAGLDREYPWSLLQKMVRSYRASQDQIHKEDE